MQHALAAVLLALAVFGAVARPWGLPAWLVPVAAGIELVARTVSIDDARSALRPLGSPLAFVLCAVPLAVMLDDVGVFVWSTPRVADDAVAKQLFEAGIDTRLIGDCMAPRNLLCAIHEGEAAALAL